MTTIFELDLFVRIVEEGSLSAAARSVGITPAAASFALKRLESRLKTRLFVRSTRNQRLTDEGMRYLECVRQALCTLAEGERDISQTTLGVSRTLQIAAPSDFGRHLLLSFLDEFRIQFPTTNFQLKLGDHARDQYKEHIDIYLKFGIPINSEIVALPIFEDHYRVACASPSYLALHGEPKSPDELANHSCILHQINGQQNNLWSFSRGTETKIIKVGGDFGCDDGEVIRRWAITGYGIVLKPWLEVVQDVKAGLLIPLFCGWRGEHIPFYLLCPHRNQITETVRSLQKLLIAKCSTLAIETFLTLNKGKTKSHRNML